MTSEQKITHYRSFLLRLWQEEKMDGIATWRGEVESIQTGRTQQFAGLESLFDFIRAETGGEEAAGVAASKGR